MLNTKLINVTHKPCKIFNTDTILTIHAGREIAEQKSKDGFLSKSDIEWMQTNTVSDATGDHISSLNRYFNEMTAIYWAWKNYEKLGGKIDALGVMHYRRHFFLKDKLKITGNYLNDIGLTNDNLSSLMAKYDIIHPPFIKTGKDRIIDKIGVEFGGKKCREAIDISLEIIKEIHPSYYEDTCNILNGNETGSFCNMFIMKKDLFFEYCEWIFPILFGLDERLGRNYKAGEERCIGMTAEILTSIFLYIKSKQHPHKEVFVFNQDVKVIKSPIKIFSQKIRMLFKYNKKHMANIINYKLFKKYCK